MRIFKYFKVSPTFDTYKANSAGVEAITVSITKNLKAVGLNGEEAAINSVLSTLTSDIATFQYVEITADEFAQFYLKNDSIQKLRKYLADRHASENEFDAILNSSFFEDSLYKCFLTPTDMTKEIARRRIELVVGDDKDIIADISKRIGLLERMVMYCFSDLMTADVISADNKAAYLPAITSYLGAVEAGAVKDRVDLEDKNALMAKLIQRFSTITEIVEVSHLNKSSEVEAKNNTEAD